MIVFFPELITSKTEKRAGRQKKKGIFFVAVLVIFTSSAPWFLPPKLIQCNVKSWSHKRLAVHLRSDKFVSGTQVD